jgi:cytochrome c biogenesis protein CcdA
MKDKKEPRLLIVIAVAVVFFICGKYANNIYVFLVENKEQIELAASIVTIISLLAIWWPIKIIFRAEKG